MTSKDIAILRLQNQQLQFSKFSNAASLVGCMGAMQAQDPSMCKWALGVRLADSSTKEIEKQLEDGNILRTHLLRPTWHLVAAEDIRWILALTAPQIKASVAIRDKILGLDEAVFDKCNRLIEKILSKGNHCTRKEMTGLLGKEGISLDNHQIAHVMMRAELDAIVCSGKKKGKEETYALIEERAPSALAFSREESLSMLALRYFSSHSPATLADFVWWSGLKVSDARKGLEAIKSSLSRENIGGLEYWISKECFPVKEISPNAHFLPAFDEYVISYKDRSAVLNPEWGKHAISSNGIFKPIALIDGQVKGVWKRTLKKDNVEVELSLFESISSKEREMLQDAASCYAKFEGKSLTLRL